MLLLRYYAKPLIQHLSWPPRFSHLSNEVVLLSCVAPMLQMAVDEGLKQCPAIYDSIGRFRGLIKSNTMSPGPLEAVDDVFTSLKATTETPGLDCETQWNSTFGMMSTILNLWNPLE